MKKLSLALAILVASLAFTSNSFARGVGGARGEEFIKMKYFCPGGTGSGGSSSDCAASTDHTSIMSLAAGYVVTEAAVIVTTAVTGSSPVILVGDDDDDDGFCDDGDTTDGTAGAYSCDAAYTTPNSLSKYYSAAKTVYLETTGTLSAGAFVVIVKGYRL